MQALLHNAEGSLIMSPRFSDFPFGEVNADPPSAETHHPQPRTVFINLAAISILGFNILPALTE